MLKPLENPHADGEAGEKTPTGWQHFSVDGRYEFAVDTEVCHSKPSSARIRGFDDSGRACVSLKSDVFQPVPDYRLSLWYRTERRCTPRGFVRFYDGVKPAPGATGFFTQNFVICDAPGEWHEFSTVFHLPSELREKHPTARVGVFLYGDKNGTVWYDDIELRPAPPSPLKNPITTLKNLYLETILVQNGEPKAALAAGPDKQSAALAERIQQRIKECTGTRLPTVGHAPPKQALERTHVIALGNIATNPFIETLYRRYYTYLDLYYPGKGGHVLRTLHNPYGTGKNVVLVGGSDDEGVAKATEALLQKLKPGKTLKLGWIMEIKLGDGLVPPPPGGPVLAWCSLGGDRPNTKFFGWHPISIALALYYMTGDPAYVEDFRRLLFATGKPNERLFDGDRMFMDMKHPLSTVYHYRGHIMPLIWDLVEESPVFTDKERLHVTNELLGHQDFLQFSACSSFAANRLLPDRHSLYEILNIWTGSRYFARSYPNPVWDERLELAERAFDTSLATPGSNTPRIQTGTVVWPILEFALYSGADEYFRPGGVFEERMDKWLFMGDEVTGRHWCYALLNATAHVLKDGRFLTVKPIPKEDLEHFRIGQSFLSGVPPKPATDLIGLRCFKMCEPNHRRLQMNVPLQEAFDFLIYRSSTDDQRQQLFLYGYYEGSKSPPRVNAILNYQNHGIRILASGQQSATFVRKDGMLESAPANAAAAKCVEEIGDLAYARTEVPDHDFSRWERSLFILKGQCLVVFDRITAREAGNYEVFVKWHPASPPKLEPDGLRWLSGDRQCAIVCADDVEIAREGRAFDFRYRGTLKQNQDRLFRTLLTAAPKQDAPPTISPFGESAAVIQAGGPALVGSRSLPGGNFAAKAEAYLVTPNTWTMVRGTRLAVQGIEIKADNPVSLSWDLSTGNLVAKAHEKDVGVTVSGKAISCAAGQEVHAQVLLPNAKELTTASLEKALSTARPKKDRLAAPEPEKDLPALGLRWRAMLPDVLTAVHAYHNGPDTGILAGTGNGVVRLLRHNGSQRWQFMTGGPVYALTSAIRKGKRILLVGSDDEHVYALNEAGDLVWKYKAKVSEWMAYHHNYHTMGGKAKVRKILPADVEGDGKLDIFIGTGGAAIERLDEDGRPLWLFTFLYGTPMSMVLAGVRTDHPGTELIAGTFDVSYDCMVRYVDPNKGEEIGGNFINRYPKQTNGPRKREPSSFAQGNVFMLLQKLPDGKSGLLRAVCGRNWNNLVMNDAATGECLWGKDFGPGGGTYLNQYISGVATSDLNGDGILDAVAGLQSGWVCAFEGLTGRLLWSTFLPSPVSVVIGGAPDDPASSTLVGCEDGTILQLDKAGRPVRHARLSGKAQVAAYLPGKEPFWVFGTNTGQLAALSASLPDAKFPDCPAPFPVPLTASADGGKSGTPLQTIGITGGLFVVAAFGESKAWTLTASEATDIDVHAFSPDRAKVSTKENRFEIQADSPGMLLARLDSDPEAGSYKRFIVIQRDCWGNMRTNGPVAKTIMDGRMGFFMAQKTGDWVDFDVPVPADGTYELAACFCKYHDRPIIDILLDGKPIKEGLDLYAEKVEWTQPVLLGKRHLTRGTHVLRFVVVGKAKQSSGHYVGLESVALVPEGHGKPESVMLTADASAVRADWREGALRFTAIFRKPGIQGPISVGDVRLDGDACAIVRTGKEVKYWELRNALSLHLNDQALAVLESRRDACSESLP